METKYIPKKATAKWAWIIYQLSLRELSLSDIARDLKVTRQAVYRASVEPRRRIEQAIASKIGFTPEAIWPERYSEKQSSRRRRRKQ